MKGKAFGNKKQINLRPQADFYEIPKCMTEEERLNLVHKNTVLEGKIWKE